ncbi:MAG: cell division protein FtsA [Gammaproteobacteria bacterium]|nr:cell division protein FtsA [Gammaproteobacteria bacterium]MYF53180.1 cell division protein FtsA [Gammaproteobacteria bacterium]MYK44171.1 cell division protein FtsA [Gammaproteobacteria bacterium]
MSTENNNILAGLDIGTSTVSASIGKLHNDGTVEVIGIGSASSTGIRHGLIVNIEAAVTALRAAIVEAEQLADRQITSAYVSINGEHIKSINSQGNSPIRSREVSEIELELALESAKAIPLSNDECVVHVIPQEYVIDWQKGIREPLGMSGTRLDANVHLITCAKNALLNVTKCVTSCDITVREIVVEPLASAASILSNDERELGVCLLDIGGGTTDVAVYADGAIRHTHVVPMAGDSVTRDIAMTFRTPAQHAEQIKIKYACALQELTDKEETIHVQGVANRPSTQIPRQTLAAVVESRYREIFKIVQDSLEEAQISMERLGSGIILAGGAANMEGIVELAEEVFHLPVSNGKPKNLVGLDDFHHSTAYTTCTGLLVWAVRSQKILSSNDKAEQINGTSNPFNALKGWIRKTF